MLKPELATNLLESAPDALVVIDESGRIVYANRQLQALLGYEPEQVLGQTVELLLPEALRARHLLHRQRFLENVRTRPMGSGLELQARHRDGTEIPVEISLSPIRNGAAGLVAAAIRDVSERRQTLIALREAREAADRANQAKSRFLATASHDLRQLLQTLALFNGALRNGSRDPLLTGALEQQEQAISAMGQLLHTLLDMSKLESGAIQPEVRDFKVAAIFNELRLEFAQLAADKALDFQVEHCDDMVRSDPALIAQALRNLVANAIKYTAKGRVQLRCRHQPPWVRLEVLDSGVGIPAQHLGHIFDEFCQIGEAGHAREGWGLGLAIVRRIVDLLGVQIDVSSEPGCGSSFSLSLPQGGEATARSAEAPLAGAAEPGACGQVLLIEDDPAVRSATQMLLRVAGYGIVTASSIREALERAAEHTGLQLIVCDYHLTGGETGVQVIASVREALGRPIKAVLMTGDTSSLVRGIAQDSALRIASKPVNAEELLGLMQQLLAG